MLKNMSSYRKSDLAGNFDNEVRFYFDPRGIEYAPISGTPAYTAVTSSDPVYGEYSLSQGNLVYMLPYSDPMTFQVLFKPAFAYNVGTDQPIIKWYSGTQYIELVYLTGFNRFAVQENVGAINSIQFGSAFTSDTQLQQWQRLTVVISGNAVALYSRNVKTTGNVVLTGRLNYQLVNIGNNSAGLINNVRFFPGYAATDQDVLDNFAGVMNEEIFFQFPKTAVGRTRCNINTATNRTVTSFGIDRSTGYKSATASVGLNNKSGEFSDDQYATYTPSAAAYNGTSTQKYLTQKVGLQLETISRQKSNIIASGLLGYWSFDEGSTSVILDYSGNGYRGANTSCTVASGISGNGYSFNGTSAFWSIPNFVMPSIWHFHYAKVSGAAPASGATTIFNIGAVSGAHLFIHRTTANALNISYWDGSARLQPGIAGFFTGFDSTPMTLDIAINFSTGAASVYRNGALVSNLSLTTPSVPASGTAYFGVYQGASNFGAAHVDDEIFMLNRAITTSELASLNDLSTYALTTDPCCDQLYLGAIAPGSFSRSTPHMDMSTVSVNAEDSISEIARRVVRKSRSWADYYLARATPSSNSVFHEIAWLATKREHYNYLTNSGFENTTIGNSWVVDAGTLTRDTTFVLQGTYCGKMVMAGATNKPSQTVLFQDLTAGEQFTGSIYIYSASAYSGAVKLYEYDGVTLKATATTSFTHSGLGWDRIVVPHTITDSNSDRIKMEISATTAVTYYVDCAMLKYGGDVPYWVLNTNDGAAGVSAIGSEIAGTYEYVGIDADDVTYQHPWAWIQQDDNVWDNLKQIGDACGARNILISPGGVLRFRSGITSALPASLGSIEGMDSVGSGQQNIICNKVSVKGCKVIKKPNVECVWQAKAAGIESDAGTASGEFSRTIPASGGTLPNVTTDGTTELDATYGRIENKFEVAR